MIYLQIFMALFVLLVLILIVLMVKNRSLKKEISHLKASLEEQESVPLDIVLPVIEEIEDLEESAVTSNDEVIHLLNLGKSREEISERLEIPVNKIDLIIKFDKIKKEKHL